MKQRFTLLLLTFIFCTAAMAQQRYTEEVFTDAQISVTSDVHYATNATILGILFNPDVDEFLPEPLFMDVYQPDQSMDTVGNRPMVLVVHGGDALPRLANNACWGDKTDSVTVTIARKLARMGYVAIAPNYRLGWNPLAQTQDAFLDGLVDAGIRVSQDMRALARHLRKDIAEDGNTYNLHPDQFAIWGTSSSAGTYSGLTAYIHEVEEVQTPTYFVTDDMGNVRNVVDFDQIGNLDGTEVGMLPNGDTTNYVNTPGYSSLFQLTALGSSIALDTGVLDVGEPPMIQFGNPLSTVTQFVEGPIQLPTTGQVVAFVQLSQGMIKEANAKGLNDAWIAADLDDPFTMFQENDQNFGGQEGWLPLYGDPDNEYPWVHWDEVNCPVSTQSFDVLPGANMAQAYRQIDTMAGYFGPRACITLGLRCGAITSNKDLLLDEKIVTLAPNPTFGQLRIEANYGRTIEEVKIFSFDGKMINRFVTNTEVFQKDDLNLKPGFYTVNVQFEDGMVVKKLIVQ